MAYNQGYGQQGQQGYGQYDPYGQSGNGYGQQNPYAQQEQPYGHTGNYSERPDLDHQTSSRYDEESQRGSNYEMSNVNGRDPNRILNEVRSIDAQVDRLEEELQKLKGLQRLFLDTTDEKANSALEKQVAEHSSDIMDTYRSLTRRATQIKSDPESQNSRNKAQVAKIERRVKTAMNQLQQIDRDFRQECGDQIARQYRIVRPDASEAEIQEVIESGGQQVFSTALFSTDRRGDAQRVQRLVKARHDALQQIEKDMIELAQLFQDLEMMVVQQEPQVAQIEENGNKTTEHVTHANTELDTAVKSAKAARRKKFYCLGIALLIIIIIVIVVVVAVLLTRGKK